MMKIRIYRREGVKEKHFFNQRDKEKREEYGVKKKVSLGLFLLAVIIAGSLFGTWAYFSKSFKSDNNVATAAVFDVDVVNKNGQTIANAEFDLDEKLYPGMETEEVYNFDIKRNNTELPLEYVVHLNKEGDLFKEGTPVVVAIERNVDGNWVQVEPNLTFEPNNNVESFRILVNWPHGDNDIAFQGLNGSIDLEVIATQIDLVADVEGAKGKIDQAKSELAALDTVNSSFNRGNFTKAQAAAVQALIDDAKTYVETFSKSSEKDELLGEIQSLQTALDEKSASRYVYYEVVEGETHFEQLKLSITGEVFSIANGRTQNNNPMYVSGMTQKNALYLKYTNQSFVKPVVGDTASFNIRFNNGVKNIDATFTNLGDGKWEIESEWLVPKGK